MKSYPMAHKPLYRVVSCLFCLAILLTLPSALWAAWGEDLDKPKPEFSRQGQTLTAKLVPRGKSTSIQIDFAVSGGELKTVEALDFSEAARPEVDVKDFRSGLFVVKAGGMQPGGDIRVSMASGYFTQSTQLWVFNPKAPKQWTMVEAEHTEPQEGVEELGATVKDGGPLDSDGKANGEVVIVVGPRDSFWGYAIGTLFIRFFGVFMVLALLEIGMFVAGRVFRTIENRAAQAKAEAEAVLLEPAAAEQTAPPPMDRGKAAAIAMALHLHLMHEKPAQLLRFAPPEAPAWSQEGRARIMSERLSVFNRESKK